jgi:hypothetical protein
MNRFFDSRQTPEPLIPTGTPNSTDQSVTKRSYSSWMKESINRMRGVKSPEDLKREFDAYINSELSHQFKTDIPIKVCAEISADSGKWIIDLKPNGDVGEPITIGDYLKKRTLSQTQGLYGGSIKTASKKTRTGKRRKRGKCRRRGKRC